jgi:hypothetical protein
MWSSHRRTERERGPRRLTAGGVVAERMQVAPATLVAGVPVTPKKELSGAAARWPEMATADYQELRERDLDGSVLRP